MEAKELFRRCSSVVCTHLKNLSIQIVFTTLLAVVSFYLVLGTYNFLPGLLFFIFYITIMVGTFFKVRSMKLKCILAGTAFAILIAGLRISHLPYPYVIEFIFIVPVLYVLLIGDNASLFISAIGIIYMFSTYTDEVGFGIAKANSIDLLFICIGIAGIKILISKFERKIELEKKVTVILSRFEGTVDIEKAIHVSLEDIGRLNIADKVFLYLLNSNDFAVDKIHEWNNMYMDCQIGSISNIPMDMFSYWKEELHSREYLFIKDVDGLPDNLMTESDILKIKNINSLIVLPIKIRGNLAGFIGLVNILNVKNLSRNDLHLLRATAEIFSNALYRHRAEEALHKMNSDLEALVQKRTQELVQSNKALSKSKKEYRQLIEFLPNAVFILDKEKILFANRAAAELIGVKEYYELLGKPIMDIIPKEDSDKVLYAYREDFQVNAALQTFEGRCVCMDGTIKAIELSVAPLFFRNKPSTLAVIRDITECKKAEKLNGLLNEAIEFDKHKTEFFTNISHELKTPLNVILSTIQLFNLLINEGSLEHKGKNLTKYINSMRQNSYRVLRLVNNLIDITRIDSGFYNIYPQKCNIVSITEDVCLSVVDYMESRGLTIRFDTDAEEKLIVCDPDKIERIMLNLLSNAAKFTDPRGSIYVNLSDKGEYISISVKDTGIGIPEDKLQVIFDRFRQVDKSLSRNHEGSGIGLSLVKSLVEMHKGTISIQSEEGKGSEFIINLPVGALACEEISAKTERYAYYNQLERINVELSDIYSNM